jgi:Fe-S oxidoreductase
MGLIHWWARLAAHAPRMVNLITHLPGPAALVKRAGGIAPQRRVPTFARHTFRQWWQRRPSGDAGGRKVILWADTFNNHFHPETARAAVRVLEAAGFRVDVPARLLCCGRPLYDFGFLDRAKRLLLQILEALREDLAAGVPVIVLEPSCASVFRDELTNLLPHDEDARRLKAQTYLLAEFLQRHAPDWTPGAVPRTAVVHGHCHQKSLMGMSADEAVLDRLGLDYEVLDSGCCGMAGAFGFEREHYDVSIACGERVLLPAVRAAAEDTLIIADGFSCREQIAQATGRLALHLAEVVAASLDTP